MKTAISLQAALVAAVLAAPATAAELSIYNWADYFGETSVSGFEEASGTKVTLDYFDSNEVLETKMLAGGSGYDVVFPAASNAERQLQAGALLPIDTSRLQNYGNLDPEILAALDKVPGGRQLGVPYTWGTIGLAYDPVKISEQLGDLPVDSWDLLFKPEYASKLKNCGVAVLDSPVEMLSVTLNYLGKDPYSETKAELAEAKELLAGMAPNVTYFSNQRAAVDLPSGNLCLAVMYSGDAGLAQARAIEAENGVEIAYAIPREGTLMWIDLMAIPVDAPNPDEAYRFIDHMLQPEVIAEVTNTVFFANANAKSDESILPEVLADPGVYPSAETMNGLFPDKSLGPKALRQRSRTWTAIKSGI
ncbi:periplasmic polyamine-binding protein, putative [Roseobacter sp. SK209-2-6]|uniref:polyamine ABC transporter substrate-binding protein n=1 Tax=Roseobacter sp. SK209-2-6 TaxID=388739 RepID=UPI0000F3D6DF|nr:polyamine ABC transporter substrate-binding protein [Roseobacter sp. SK209-2-6]EBA17341.1 periplasmic polyamine-binding protein, putative [Roseobacter sp. SK209-2-6]